MPARRFCPALAGAVAAAVLPPLLAAGCAGRAPVATVPVSPTPAAAAARAGWIDERLRRLRAAEREGEATRARAAGDELEAGGVDWRSFLTPIRGSTDGEWGFLGESLRDHTLRQVAQKLNLVRDVRQILGIPDRANDLADDGSVLDSAFFTNRDPAGISPEDVRREAGAHAPKGRLWMTDRKAGGTSEGFLAEDEAGDPFIVIMDPPDFPEMSTAAEIVGSTLLRLAGWNTPWSAIVDLEALEADPDAAREKGIMEGEVARFRGRRGVATRMITDGFRGSWTYAIHRERRALRALHVFAAWLNNTDQVDHNTLVELFDEENGLLRYYVIDFSGALGASSARVKDPHDGYVNNKVDVHRGLTWPLRLLAAPFGHRDPWDEGQRVVSPAVGRFEGRVEPRQWKPYYPNLAYEDLDEADAEWAARLVGRFSDELIQAVVELARYSRPEDAAYVSRALAERRDAIVRTYLEEDP